MADITLKSQRFDKNKFNETIDTRFSQLLTVPNPSYFDRNLAVERDVFYLYNKYFDLIPKLGAVDSHTYIARTSGEYADFDQTDLEIKALLEEIKELRIENLELIQNSTDLDINNG
jgi:hypothetical protein|tara:strand:+ start:1893 stop:2240 length:348 start_codon:yes stop_codon:yes gene_type:complete